MKVLIRSSIYVAVVWIGFAACSWAQESHIGKLTGHVAAGKDTFARYCNGCHGVRGDGNGTFAQYLDPRPRDYTLGVFKCRSTPSGSLPTDKDLYNTMSRGIVTAAMPSWASLTPEIRADVIAYLKTFCPRFTTEKPGEPIDIPSETAGTIVEIKQGAEVYRKMECARCHGALGHGDGPDAPTLVDIKKRPIPPYDFTLTERFKCGGTNTDLYRTFMTGMDGTPMPSYADKLAPEQVWALVHFVRTLQTSHKSRENKTHAAGGSLALSPSAP